MNYLQKKKLAFMSIVNSVKGFIRTITGVFPLTLTNCVDEESIIDYTLYGQSVQNGTPTPDNPIEVECVGEKTANLINWDLLLGNATYPITKVDNGYYSTKYFNLFEKSSNLVKHIKSVLKPNTTYTLSRRYSGARDSANGSIMIQNSASTNIIHCRYGEGLVKTTFTLTQEQIDSIDHLYIYFHNNGGAITNLQLTESNTVLPYEPYGYKIPITASSNGKTVTTNIYLDEPLGEGQSINYKKDGLPPLPTFKGTTVISADTTVQPSNAEIEYYSNVKE